MVFQQLLVAAAHFIEEQRSTYREHLDAVRDMEDASEDSLWELYLEMQRSEPPPAYYTDVERVLWYINKVNPHPKMVHHGVIWGTSSSASYPATLVESMA